MLHGEVALANAAAVLSPAASRNRSGHCAADAVLDTGARRSAATLVRAARAGVDFRQLAHDLEREGIASFCTSYAEVLDSLSERINGSWTGRRWARLQTAAPTG